jgi:hypothetical protein
MIIHNEIKLLIKIKCIFILLAKITPILILLSACHHVHHSLSDHIPSSKIAQKTPSIQSIYSSKSPAKLKFNLYNLHNYNNKILPSDINIFIYLYHLPCNTSQYDLLPAKCSTRLFSPYIRLIKNKYTSNSTTSFINDPTASHQQELPFNHASDVRWNNYLHFIYHKLSKSQPPALLLESNRNDKFIKNSNELNKETNNYSQLLSSDLNKYSTWIDDFFYYGTQWLSRILPTLKNIEFALPPLPVRSPLGTLLTQATHLVSSPVKISFLETKQSKLFFKRDSTQIDTHPLTNEALSNLMLPLQANVQSYWQSLYDQFPHRDENRIMIIGDSLSANERFFKCFDRDPLRIFDQDLEHWIHTLRVQSANIMRKDSFAAQPGATSWSILNQRLFPSHRNYGAQRSSFFDSQTQKDHSISPSSYHKIHKNFPWITHNDLEYLQVPLLREVFENNARFAWVLLGTNDMNYHKGKRRFFKNYLHSIELLLLHGVIPILFTIPPRFHKSEDLNKIMAMNQMIHTISHILHLPLVDLYQYFKVLKRRPFRKDGIHFNAYKGGCYLLTKGLTFGHNRRNYIAMLAFKHSVELWKNIQNIILAPDLDLPPTTDLDLPPTTTPLPNPISNIIELSQQTQAQTFIHILMKIQAQNQVPLQNQQQDSRLISTHKVRSIHANQHDIISSNYTFQSGKQWGIIKPKDRRYFNRIDQIKTLPASHCRQWKSQQLVLFEKNFTLTKTRQVKSFWFHNVTSPSIERFWISVHSKKSTYCIKIKAGSVLFYLPVGTHQILQVVSNTQRSNTQRSNIQRSNIQSSNTHINKHDKNQSKSIQLYFKNALHLDHQDLLNPSDSPNPTFDILTMQLMN